MSRPKRMNPFVVKLEQEPEEQRRKTEGSLNQASASSVTDGETNRIACLEAEVAAKAAEIEQKDAEITALKAEVKWLQSDRVTPQQMLQELDWLHATQQAVHAHSKSLVPLPVIVQPSETATYRCRGAGARA